MFPDIPFYKINREERHFGFLLFSSILSDEKFRLSFLELLQSKRNIDFSLEENMFEIFAEVSLFRDYWHNFGDYKIYSKELHSARKLILVEMMEMFKIDHEIIRKYPLFWTKELGKSKICYPGRWNKEMVNEVEGKEFIADQKLMRIKWIFNAKPDFLFIYGNNAFYFELKYESNIGRDSEGYDQIRTQEDIIGMARNLIPYLKDKKAYHIKITTTDKDSILWNDIIELFEDGYVKRHLLEM